MHRTKSFSHKVLTVVPAYNEAKNIVKVLEKARKCQVISELLVVDDGSQDNTTHIAREYGVQVVRHTKNLGPGAAKRSGIDYAIEKGFHIVTFLDGDGQHNSDEIPLLIEPIIKGECDFCIGSRYLESSNLVNPPLFRLLTTKLYTLIFNILIGGKFTDVTNGFRAIRTAILKDKSINLWQDWLNGYELEPYLFYQLVKRNYRIKEIPATVIYHSGAKSHIRPIIDWWKIIRPLFLLKLRLKK